VKIKSQLSQNFSPLGVLTYRNLTGIFVRQLKTIGSAFYIFWSDDLIHYKTQSKEIIIYATKTRKENPKLCSHFHFSKGVDGWIASYIRTEKNGSKEFVIATSIDLQTWQVKSSIDIRTNDTALAVNPGQKANYNLYMGGLFVTIARSKDMKLWKKEPGLLFTSRHSYFDYGDIHLMGSTMTKRGILVFYDASRSQGPMHLIQAGAVLFAKDDPSKVIWRSELPIWRALIQVTGKKKIFPLGVVALENKTILYWGTEDGAILSSTLTTPFNTIILPEKGTHYLKKHPKNPIIAPSTKNEWENQAVFNPAAIYDNGKVHLLYRAIGSNGISVLGYASSSDGFNFDHRLDHPVYEPVDGGLPDLGRDTKSHKTRTYNPLLYTSGGGWGGCEDPRAVKIGKRIYVTYLAFGGWNSMRLAITSISEKDLEDENWKWTKPRYISPPGQVHKNWVLFPEKIKGKYAILHSITPKISVHYVSSLKEFNGHKFIRSQAPLGGRQEYWDNKVRGAGPPPIKTKLGWLVLYHANDAFDPHKYKLGAMILDKDDPTKVLYRTSYPIMSPDMSYENNGKPGVVYASGAIIKDNELLIYYGGADKVVCVASAPIDEFLEKIKEDVQIELRPQKSLTV
jgi:predicted GH43/DUF377 family glycosyl hydrolase